MDWIIPVRIGFKQENIITHLNDDQNRTPMVDVWRSDIGLAVGCLQIPAGKISLPVEMGDSRGAFIWVNHILNIELKIGESFTTFETFVSVHRGDVSATFADNDKLLKHY